MYRFVLILSCFLFIACSADKQASMDDQEHHHAKTALSISHELEIEPPRTTQQSPSPKEFDIDKASKIIKRGYIKFDVENIESAKTKVDHILKECKGYYENDQFNTHPNKLNYSLQLRVPNAKFDSLLTVVEFGIGELKSKSVNASDVTEEYLDLNVRLNNNMAYLDQYKEILKKAQTIKEILIVQQDIRRMEEEIESKKGRLKYLEDQADYSTLNIELSELIVAEIAGAPGFGTKVITAFNNGVNGFLFIFIALVNIWPFFFVLLMVFIARRSIRKLIGA